MYNKISIYTKKLFRAHVLGVHCGVLKKKGKKFGVKVLLIRSVHPGTLSSLTYTSETKRSAYLSRIKLQKSHQQQWGLDLEVRYIFILFVI